MVYLVERNDPIDYDEYDAVVVTAPSAGQAMEIAMSFSLNFTQENSEVLEVSPYLNGVILASWNAG